MGGGAFGGAGGGGAGGGGMTMGMGPPGGGGMTMGGGFSGDGVVRKARPQSAAARRQATGARPLDVGPSIGTGVFGAQEGMHATAAGPRPPGRSMAMGRGRAARDSAANTNANTSTRRYASNAAATSSGNG